MKNWLAGKKTYLIAALVCLVAAGLVFAQKLTPEVALMVALFALAGFSATFRAALERHHAEAIALLTDISEAGAAVAAHHLNLAINDGKDAAIVGAQLAKECQAEKQA